MVFYDINFFITKMVFVKCLIICFYDIGIVNLIGISICYICDNISE